MLRGIGKNLEGIGSGLLDALLFFPKSPMTPTYASEQSASSDKDSNRATFAYKQQALPIELTRSIPPASRFKWSENVLLHLVSKIKHPLRKYIYSVFRLY